MASKKTKTLTLDPLLSLSLSLSLSLFPKQKRSNWNPSARWPAPRASALDAARLDSELASLLAEQLGRALAPILRPGVAARLHPELTGALGALAFFKTVAVGAPTPGLALLGLRFVDNRSSSWWLRWLLPPRRRRGDRTGGDGGGDGGSSSSDGNAGALAFSPPCHPSPLSVGQRVSYGLATVALTYAWDRAARSGLLASLSEAPEGSRLRRAAGLLRNAEAAASVAALANSVLFLAQRSRSRSLLEAALGAGLEPVDPAAPRTLSFDYLNRQLVWRELSELVLAVLPLLDRRLLARARRAVSGVIALPSGALASSSSSSSSSAAAAAGASAAASAAAGAPEAAEANAEEGGREENPPVACGTCGAAPPCTPFAALPCRHAHCYYCLASICAADPGHECWCGERVAAMVRLR